MSTEYKEPKISWAGSQAPLPSDMNRIEGNIKATHEAVLNEAAARHSADSAESNARISADSAEANARISADAATLNSAISGNAAFFIENRTDDPVSPAVGHLWIRVDL